ncbi:MAG: hypothetical protein DI538_03990 [Azospira oryzae]|jgi:ELWxxDGT repeat protein|nr:MAG: hypothetical protein DI538_03990 [Azospira oryzae]
MKSVLIILISLRGIITLIAQPQLVKDVNPKSEFTTGSGPRMFTRLNNNTLLFTATSTSTGQELWKSDGTEAGTALVKDINPGVGGTRISSIVSFKDNIYFTADDGNGNQLWKTNGTESGTVKVQSQFDGYFISDLIVLGDFIYFSASDSNHGQELWKSDGTSNGTTLVKDINPGPGSAFSTFAFNFTAVNDILIFTANDGVHGLELWKTDGSEAGTTLVKDMTAGTASSEFFYLTAFNGNLYFNGNNGITGQRLWKSDGTEAGTVEVLPGAGGPVSSLTTFRDELYFNMYTTAIGSELWKSDGTQSGTVLVKDINPGAGSSTSGGADNKLILFKDNLYFGANDGAHDYQLWKTDGTENGTMMVKQINPTGSAFIQGFCVANNILFFSAVRNQDQELWKTDGTESGTLEVKNISAYKSSSPFNLINLNNQLFFTANDGRYGNELWKTDGTEQYTVLIKDINTNSMFYPQSLATAGNNLYFQNNGSNHNLQIWKSDGTTAGTSQIKEFDTDKIEIYNSLGLGSNYLFNFDDGVHGLELWKSDGTENGTVMIKDINPTGGSDPGVVSTSLITLGTNTFFSANDGTHGSELWRTDGTSEGTNMVKDLNSGIAGSNPFQFINLNGTIYFLANSFELWKTDGTEAGTSLVKNVNESGSGWNSYFLTPCNDMLFFVADDGIHGIELWKSDGTTSGTGLVKDIYTGLDTHYMSILGVHNGIVYFNANDGESNYEIWKSDGTEQGTTMLKDINPGPNGSGINSFLSFKNHFYFAASTPAYGSELWRSDGTEQGTILVKDINPGAKSSDIYSGWIALDDLFYFNANDGIHGTELWKSDGTANGTKLVYDINKGTSSSELYFLTPLNHELYFIAEDNIHGRELWKFNSRFQTISFDELSDKIATDPAFIVSASSYSGLPVSFEIMSGPATIEGNKISLTGSGLVKIKAIQQGNEKFDAAEPVERSFNVTKADQTITFNALEDKTSDSAPFDLDATATSLLPVSFTIVSGPAEISGKTVMLKSEGGTVTIKASQSGNEKYKVAESVERSFFSKLILGLESNDEIHFFPNPVSETLYITLDENSEVSEIGLINSTGQSVLQQKVDVLNIAIPVSQLSKGIYFLQLKGKVTQTKKLIVE